VLVDEGSCEFRPSGVAARLNGWCPCQWDRVASSGVIEHGEFFLAADVVGAVGHVMGGGGLASGWWDLVWVRSEWHCPHTCGTVAVTSEDNLVLQCDNDGVTSERSGASMVGEDWN
jgi:hypothetical protein